ncbi:hypothetical protein BMT55_03515 [Listeria newyorkensis]|uniref:Glycosyl transferase family 1 domain-containing protein n=1 Tax=Listeria newyorkensis TaxID=1497681 RepID=A0ABX4XP53_9LIST|nr:MULTISPECIES: glycosyltransferase family 4 protein [Listeria]KGL41300.1 hypothetical protein EP56_11995 [Listeriaceae bacterium FSL A5-0209]KGL44636.1 hypothetical protein EP58_03925 [Listeria newyorkensis]KMT62312.1 glycosytransferase [Listeria newyorkensis]PNP93849.1 hypothetical protein BMT55_03515 [Listeria newyorkensis]RQW67352.1 glycosyltransferase family 1 protein [Listeria sp. SHR_NRA_18]
MKKVAMIGPGTTSKGGIATVIANFEKTFSKDTVKIHYIASWREGNSIFRMLVLMKALFQFCMLLLAKKIDIAHIHIAQKGSFYRKVLFMRTAKMFRRKVILHMHGSQFDLFYDDRTPKQQQWIKKQLNHVDELIVLSEEWAKFYKQICKVKITIVENAVEVPTSNPYTNDGKTVVMFGRLGERKGTYDLLKAVELLGEKYATYEFVLYGDGDLEQVTQIIETKALSNVKIGGWIEAEQKKAVMDDAIIHVLPSYHEGLPMAILETMANGIPNISTPVGGIPQVIQHRANSGLVSPGDVEELSRELAYLLDNDVARKEQSQKAYTMIQTKFSIGSYNKKWESIYKGI